MTQFFPNLKTINIQEAQQTPCKRNSDPQLRHIIIKLSKARNKEGKQQEKSESLRKVILNRISNRFLIGSFGDSKIVC